jgi:hypothetical protein
VVLAPAPNYALRMPGWDFIALDESDMSVF